MRLNRPSVVRSRPSFLQRVVLALVVPVLALALALAPAAAHAQSTALLNKLNAPAARVQDKSKSSTRLFTAYLDVTKAPKAVGEDFNQTSIWPGMDGWADVAKWAEANANMGKTLQEVQDCVVLGVPYGTAGVDPKFIERGLTAEIGVGGDLTKNRFGYLKALETISAYAVAELYRQCEAGNFDAGFKVGIANLRLLRQACDAQMYAEKLAAMTMLSDALSVHRDALFVYGDKMPLEVAKDLSLKQYPFLKAGDTERLKRIEMPEGDLFVADELIRSVFDSGGSVSDEKFSKTFASLQSTGQPLTGFGASKRWAKIAGVHGSLDASLQKLNAIYDDWWRRWRLPAYGPMINMATVFSKTNPVKYAAVVLALSDIDQLFQMRRRLIAEFDGTVCAAGLTSYHADVKRWPDDIKKAYTSYFPKRFNFDPYDKDYGQFKYDYLGSSSRGIESEYGRVEASGCLLYARNDDNALGNASRHAAGGKEGDFVIWPALRAISRGQAK
jgi:hypothetical protein